MSDKGNRLFDWFFAVKIYVLVIPLILSNAVERLFFGCPVDRLLRSLDENYTPMTDEEIKEREQYYDEQEAGFLRIEREKLR